MIEIEVWLFNSLRRYGPPDGRLNLCLEDGTPVREVARRLGLPDREIFVTFLNGRNVMTTFGGVIEDDAVLAAGDRLAFSGPVPFSRGYGAPVC